MKIQCLGGCREVGGNAFLLDNKEKIMLDFGVVVEDQRMPKLPEKVDMCLLAHAHLDHSGSVPALNRLNKFPPVYATASTFDQAYLILQDSLKVARLRGLQPNYSRSDMKQMSQNEVRVNYGEKLEIGSGSIEIHDAGHIAGSTMFLVEVEGKRILYTSDFGITDSRLVKGADMKKIKDIDILIMESTYASRDHPDRKQTEKDFITSVKETIENGGIALIPSFAIGRSAEMLMVLDSFKHDFPVYIDGMARTATNLAMDNPEFLRDPKALQKAISNTRFIKRHEERKEIIKNPCAIVTTGGCLDGGPAAMYMNHLWNRQDSSLLMTGFQIPRTAGRYLIDTGRYVTEEVDFKVKMNMKQFDFSGHAGRSELFSVINKIRPKHVVCMHGDNCQRFATEISGRFEGTEAIAPKIGDVLHY
ncbi:MAG: MBL fold metallo-hydrolase [Candidatus Aenigmarchaeota archaeon]|nr:MBL fold metallo-hydrolase [Candidatus Aenigmarchaeota archaeon]